MSQNFTEDWYEITYVADTGFQAAENNDNALKSNFSGSNAPSFALEDGVPWFDIDTGVLKIRRGGAWVSSLLGDSDTKVWIYRNDTAPGWIIDPAAPTDVVLGLVGGNYGSVGGVVLGDWAVSGLSTAVDGAHSHRYKNHTGSHDWTWDSNGVAIEIGQGGSTENEGIITRVTQADGFLETRDWYTGQESGHNHTITSNSLWRPQAAVGTMQIPNLV